MSRSVASIVPMVLLATATSCAERVVAVDRPPPPPFDRVDALEPASPPEDAAIDEADSGLDAEPDAVDVRQDEDSGATTGIEDAPEADAANVVDDGPAELDADAAPDIVDGHDGGDAPDGGACADGTDRCGTRVCAPGPCELRAPRSLAPIATLRLHTARPWFRWELPTGAEGARLEVCATPRCDRVEHSWEVEGARFRPPVALSPGVHFWRLTARRGGHLTGAAGPPWSFAVDLTMPTRETQHARRDALLDVNGDGEEEEVVPVRDPPFRSWAFELVLSGTSPPARQYFRGGFGYLLEKPGTRPRGRTYSLHGVYPIGDINGDGLGDLLLAERESYDLGGGDLTLDLFLGGRGGVGPPLPLGDPRGLGSTTGPFANVDVITAGDVNGDGYGDALLNWYVGLGFSLILVGGADHHAVGDGCGYLVGWIGHGDVDADGYEDLMATSVSRSTWSDTAFAFLPGGPAVGRTARCGGVARRLGVDTPLHLPPGVRAHVFDTDDDGYDDVVIDNDWSGGALHHVFRGGPAGFPFTE